MKKYLLIIAIIAIQHSSQAQRFVQVLDSIDALRSANANNIYTNAFVTGYRTPGDGGEGTFTWVKSDSTTTNLGTVFGSANSFSPPGRWIRQYSGPINIKWFGAKGDGATDDTAAITNALAVCAGETLLIPPGTYIHSHLMSPAPNTTLSGYGATIKAADDLGNTYNEMGFEILSNRNVTISGLTYDGNRAERAALGGSAFSTYIAHSRNIRLIDVTIQNSPHDGVEIAYDIPTDPTSRSFDCYFQNVTVTNAYRNAFSLDGAVNTVFIGCKGINTSGTNPQTGFDVEALVSTNRNENNWFYGCTATGNVGDGITFASYNYGGGVIGGMFASNGRVGVNIPVGVGVDNLGVAAYYPVVTNNTGGNIVRASPYAIVEYVDPVQQIPTVSAGVSGNTYVPIPASANTGSRIVIRDANGDFIARNIQLSQINFGLNGINGFLNYSTDFGMSGPASGKTFVKMGNNSGPVELRDTTDTAQLSADQNGVTIKPTLNFGSSGANGSIAYSTDTVFAGPSSGKIAIKMGNGSGPIEFRDNGNTARMTVNGSGVTIPNTLNLTGSAINFGGGGANGFISYSTDLTWTGPTSGRTKIKMGNGSSSIDFRTSGDLDVGRFDSDSTAGNTRFLLWDVDSSTLKRVSVGTADSGGTGFKVLRIPN